MREGQKISFVFSTSHAVARMAWRSLDEKRPQGSGALVGPVGHAACFLLPLLHVGELLKLSFCRGFVSHFLENSSQLVMGRRVLRLDCDRSLQRAGSGGQVAHHQESLAEIGISLRVFGSPAKSLPKTCRSRCELTRF